MDAEEKVEFLYAPILPSDLNNDKNPFDRGEKNLSSLGGMLGIRAAQIFGIGEEAKISDDVAKALGVVDALRKRHIRVPEDVIVTGYGGMEEGKYFIPNIETTTIAIPDPAYWIMPIIEFIVLLVIKLY